MSNVSLLISKEERPIWSPELESLESLTDILTEIPLLGFVQAGKPVDISEQQQLHREILEIPVSEQRRIGQELHDGLGQQLTGLGLLATSLLGLDHP